MEPPMEPHAPIDPSIRVHTQVFDEVWWTMKDRTKDKVRAKAQWEHMTLSAVIQTWWKGYWEAAQKTVDARMAVTPRKSAK